jgi:hypothetical protein
VYVIGRRYCNKYCLWANCSDRSLKYHNIVFSFVHCVVCSSPIYGFWLPLWYRQTLPMDTNKTSVSTGFLSDFGTVRGGCISVFFLHFITLLRQMSTVISYIMPSTSYILMTWWWCWIIIVLGHWHHCPWGDMSLHSYTISWFRANHSLLFLPLSGACAAEKQHIPIL